MFGRYVDVATSCNQVLILLKEFILLSDILGLSLLVDSINHPKPAKSTEGTVLGPFHTHDAEPHSHGDSISHDPQGEACLVVCTVKDTSGGPIPGVKIDIWETDSTGHYDVQYPGRDQPDGRAVIKSDESGDFWFNAIVPVPYPIPHDVCTYRLNYKPTMQIWTYGMLISELGSRRQAP
jgi:protocatechuate 3,4-dioxygenase beta subunit